MKALTFSINLLEPLLATGLEGDPNSGVSQNYVAGSVLRGSIIGLYLRNNRLKNLDLTDKERKLFFDGSVRFLNSYPLVKNKRSLPTPLAWQKEKDEDGKDFKNFCVEERNGKADDSKKRDDKTYKNLSNPFFVFDETDVYKHSNEIISVSPKKRLAVHINRSITGNTGGDNDSQVFRYESVAEGTKFSGAILSGCADCLREIEELIKDKKINLGGSRTAGYGKAEFETIEFVEDWYEPQVSIDVEVEQGKVFSITLLSNALVRDENGQFQTDLAAEVLGINATTCAEKTFKRAELVGGFNRKWGLPLPQQLSIKAGSVLSFTAKEAITKDKIKELHQNGIGERKLDGFGRIAFNLNNENQKMRWKEPKEKIDNKPFQSDFSDKMVMRILRQKMDSQLITQTNTNKIVGKISNSQISRLRLHIREILRKPEITKEIVKQEIDGFFSQLKSTALNQFQSVKVKDSKLEEWVKNKIDNLDAFGAEKTITLGEKVFKNEGLLVEYHLHLIDGILAQAAKENNK